jgi:hypothetical protein
LEEIGARIQELVGAPSALAAKERKEAGIAAKRHKKRKKDYGKIKRIKSELSR